MSINPAFMPMTMGGGGYNDFINNMSPRPLLWYRMDEAASPAINYGSVASVNGVAANMGAFQAAGPNSIIPLAYDFNGTTSIVTVPVAAGLATPDFTLACLVNPDTTGEGNTGCFFEGLDAASAVVVQWFFINAGTRLRAFMTNTAGANINISSATGPTLGAWVWLFMQFNATTGLGQLWQSVTGTLTEFAYNPTHSALAGTPRQIGQGTVGNNPATGRTFDGKYAQFMIYGKLLTTIEMQAIITASGVV